MPKQAEANKNDVMNTQNNEFSQINKGNLMFSKIINLIAHAVYNNESVF